MNKKPLTFPSTYYPRGPKVNANIKNMSKCYAIKKFLLYYFQKYLFVVANMRENSLDQLIEISYGYNIKMDQFDQTEDGYSKCGCEYGKIQKQNSIFELLPKMVVSKFSVLTVSETPAKKL